MWKILSRENFPFHAGDFISPHSYQNTEYATPAPSDTGLQWKAVGCTPISLAQNSGSWMPVVSE
jgi:hypothetical protein